MSMASPKVIKAFFITWEDENKLKDLTWEINKTLNNRKLKEQEKIDAIKILANRIILEAESVEGRWSLLQREG